MGVVKNAGNLTDRELPEVDYGRHITRVGGKIDIAIAVPALVPKMCVLGNSYYCKLRRAGFDFCQQHASSGVSCCTVYMTSHLGRTFGL